MDSRRQTTSFARRSRRTRPDGVGIPGLRPCSSREGDAWDQAGGGWDAHSLRNAVLQKLVMMLGYRDRLNYTAGCEFTHVERVICHAMRVVHYIHTHTHIHTHALT